MHHTLTTPRLLLRQWVDGDLEPFAAFRAWKARVAGLPGHLATRYDYSIDPYASRDL